jgi:hypothetical protein
MASIEHIDDEAIGSGFSGAEIKSTARRQFVASAAVAVIIAIGAGLLAMAPAKRDYAEVAPRRIAIVQHPTFATPLSDRVASATREIEPP